MKHCVVYYSQTGRNEYLAKRCAAELKAEIHPLVPRLPGLVMLATVTKISMGNKPLRTDFSQFDSIVLVGPLYSGNLAAPCKDFLKRHEAEISRLHLLSCCGGADEKRFGKYGYEKVFSQVRSWIQIPEGTSMGFPIELVLEGNLRDDLKAKRGAKLNDKSFGGEMLERFENTLQKIRSTSSSDG